MTDTPQEENVTKEMLDNAVKQLEERLITKLQQLQANDPNTEDRSTHNQERDGPSQSATDQNTTGDILDIQGRAKAIHDSLRSVIIPSELRLNDSRGHSGIRKNDQPTANIISKCAYFCETALKLLGTLSTDTVSETNLQDLHTILHAQIEYLQDEYSTLFIQGTFPADCVTRFYKNFNKGTSALLPRHRKALTTAVNILGPAGQCTPETRGDFRPSFRRGRDQVPFRHRGTRRGSQGQGHYYPGQSARSDVFQDAVTGRFGSNSTPFRQHTETS